MIALLISRALQILIAIVTMRILTEFLTPDELGRMSLILSIITFIILIFVNPISSYINRQLNMWVSEGSLTVHLKWALHYLFLITVLITIVLSFSRYISFIKLQYMNQFTIFIIAISIFGMALNQSVVPLLNLLGFRVRFAMLSTLSLLSSLICSIILTLYFLGEAEYWLLGQFAGQISTVLIATIIIASWYKKRYTKSVSSMPDTEAIIGFIVPLSLSTGLFWVQMYSYRFVLEYSKGVAAVGLFVAGYNLAASIISTLENLLTQYLLPSYYERVACNDIIIQTKVWNDYAKIMLPALFITFVFIFSYSAPIAKLLLGTSFQTAYKFMYWGALAESLRVLAGAYTLIAHTRMNTYSLFPAHFMGAIVALVASFVLIPLYQNDGPGLQYLLLV